MRLAESGGQSLFTLGLPVFDLSRADYLSLLRRASTNIFLFLFKSTYHLKDTHNLQKNHIGLELERGL